MTLNKQHTSGVPGVPNPGLPTVYPFPESMRPIPFNTRDVEAELTRLISGTEPKVQRWLYSTWNAEASAIKYQELRNAIRDNLIPEKWITQWSEDYADFVNNTLYPEWEKAGLTGGLNVEGGIMTAFGGRGLAEVPITTAAIEGWIDGHAAELAKSLTDGQTTAVGNIIKRFGVEMGLGPEEVGRYLRPALTLTPGESMAVANYRTSLIEEGVRLEKVEHMTQNYSGRLHRLRGRRIAQTEMAYAYNRGMLDSVRAYQQADWISPLLQIVKIWQTAEDERMCPYCDGLHGAVVGVEEQYTPTATQGTGENQRTIELDAVVTPPAHVNCRCATIYEARRV